MDHRQLFDSVAQLVRHLVLRHPVLLILEDLHWGDEMSLRLLPFVARRLRSWPILVVGTAREEELAGAPLLRRTLEDLARDQRFGELRLAPLSKQDTLTLVRTLVPRREPRAHDELARRAGLVHQRGQPVRGGGDRARAPEGAAPPIPRPGSQCPSGSARSSSGTWKR